jgi:PIN domain nuclease of toxin-antitoxin system
MIVAVGDTHTVIWYLSGETQLSTNARSFIEITAKNGDQIAISSISLVEMIYLIEKARIPALRFSQLAAELENPESLFVQIPVDLKIARILSRIDVMQIPDMPDRIVEATALHLDVPVISRDRKIRLSAISTIW